MAKTKYRCLRTVVVDDRFKGTKDEVKFVEGRNYPLGDVSYARWERRGVFGPIPEKKGRRGKKAADPAPAEDPAPEGGKEDAAAAMATTAGA